MISKVYQLAVKLGLNVTAEGIETPLQADILTHLGSNNFKVIC